jgi:methionine aminopeptidase
VLKTAADGISVLDLVKLSDDLIFERTSKLYNNKKGITKGVAFPTSISVNNVVGHFAPMEKDSPQPMLKTGDIVKV